MSRDKNKETKKRRLNPNSVFYGDLAQLEFSGNREVVIEGSRGVLEYSSSVIRINTDSMIVCFSGRGLNLKCISPSALIIEGFITGVEFVV